MVCALRCWRRPTAASSGCASRAGRNKQLRRSFSRPAGGCNRKQCDERDDGLRDDTVETPDFKDARLDAGEVESEGKARERCREEQAVAAEKRKDRDGCVASDANSGYGNAVN